MFTETTENIESTFCLSWEDSMIKWGHYLSYLSYLSLTFKLEYGGSWGRAAEVGVGGGAGEHLAVVSAGHRAVAEAGPGEAG